MEQVTYKSPLHQTISITKTDYWNDSCSVSELTYGIEHGAVGATTNPSIVLAVLKKEMPLWRDRIYEVINANPTWSEDQIMWQIFEEIAVHGSKLLLPVFERESGRKGRLSIQTNPANYRSPQKLIEQALHFNTLAPNMQIKVPVTAAGIEAIEEITFHGVSINATVSFSLPQAIAVAEAVERGLKRREAAGHDTASMSPVCTLMVGRLDDWLKVLEKRDSIVVTPGYTDWAGIAVFKKAYGLYQQRGYRARLLAAAYRHHMHWSQLIGGDIVLTIPFEWARLINGSDIEVKERINDPVPQEIIDTLYAKFPDFRRSYDEDGMTPAEFDSYGPSARTLRTFIASYHDLVGLIRDFMLPNPDVKPS